MDALDKLELEGYKRFFDKLVLEKYPDTIITRHSDFNKEIEGIVFTDEQDEIYFGRLEQVIKQYEGTEMFKRYDELLDIEIEENSKEGERLLKQSCIDELAAKGKFVSMTDMDEALKEIRNDYREFRRQLENLLKISLN